MSGLAGMYDLRDEAQAQEYLEKLGTEYRFQCFHEKLADGCHRLGDFFEAFKRDMTRARKVYKANCDDSQHGPSCFKYGNYALIGRAGEKDAEEAFRYFLRGCEKDHIPSCYNVGLLYQDKKRLPNIVDHQKAVMNFEKCCDLDDRQGCFMASVVYLQGQTGVAKDLKKSFNLAQKACDMGHIYGCVNLSQMYMKGDGVEKCAELAEKYKSMAKRLHKEATDPELKLKMGQSS